VGPGELGEGGSDTASGVLVELIRIDTTDVVRLEDAIE
jgi:hypothetical protein